MSFNRVDHILQNKLQPVFLLSMQLETDTHLHDTLKNLILILVSPAHVHIYHTSFFLYRSDCKC